MFHKITLIGYLGQDPEKRFTPAGKSVVNFSVAINDQKETIWMRATCFDRLADICHEYLVKGSMVYLEGRLSHEKGKPKVFKTKSGDYMANFEMIVDRAQFLSKQESNEEVPF